MTYREGDQNVIDSREWVSPYPLTRNQALDVMRAIVLDIIEESGQNAIDAAFWMEVK